MRAFVVSIVIIILISAIAVTNTLWSCRKIDGLLYEIEALTPDDAEKLPPIINKWKRARKVFTFTVRRACLREIDGAFQRMEAALALGDEYEFDTAKSALIYNMKELRSSQSFEIMTVL